MESCSCHRKRIDENKSNKKAILRLVIACVMALIFVIGEFIGGYFSHSLAIMTDAAHMLSDFASFLISLFSIWMATRPPSKRMSFGWYRAEVIGAVASVFVIWIITGALVYEAVKRLIHDDEVIDADIMLITACVGVFFNVFIGILIAGYIIKFFPKMHFIDSVCTFIFSILVIISTFSVLRDAVLVLMEGVPYNIDTDAIEKALMDLPDVALVHNIHVWSLTVDKIAIAVHIAVGNKSDTQSILTDASNILKTEYGFSSITIQVEHFQKEMETCETCQKIPQWK
uniref:Cation efflux protein cytoplasmic domain-containing protein n=1 Tax=Amphimedon queenslandica TaxID=400682 RepID=A0A1X7VC35_AMPQE